MVDHSPVDVCDCASVVSDFMSRAATMKVESAQLSHLAVNSRNLDHNCVSWFFSTE